MNTKAKILRHDVARHVGRVLIQRLERTVLLGLGANARCRVAGRGDRWGHVVQRGVDVQGRIVGEHCHMQVGPGAFSPISVGSGLVGDGLAEPYRALSTLQSPWLLRTYRETLRQSPF